LSKGKLDLKSRLSFAISIAKEMGAMQLAFTRDQLETDRKGDDSPVTQVDIQSEQLFRKRVQQYFPDDQVLGEEQGQSLCSGARWVLDPIDGTRKFMRGLPFWGICIAYEVEQDVQLGVIAVPSNGLVWSALKNEGAYCNDKAIMVDQKTSELSRAFVTMPSRPYFEKDGFVEAFDACQRWIEHDPGFLDAYSYGMLADGRIHGVLSCSDKWWDISAAVCIVEAAGGKFTSIDGSSPKEGSLNLAASEKCHGPLLEKLNHTLYG